MRQLRMSRMLFFCASVSVVIAAVAVFASIAFAQDAILAETFATLSIEGANALAITADGQRLLVSDASASQVRVYGVNDVFNAQENPARLDLYGTPFALAATNNFGLAAIGDGGTNQVQVFQLRGRGDTTVNLFDIPQGPTAIMLSPDQRWAVVIGQAGYAVMELLSGDNINFYVYDVPITHAALTDDTVLLVQRGSNEIETKSLNAGSPPEVSTVLALSSGVDALAVNENGSLGAAALNNGDIVFFNPASLTETGSYSHGGSVLALAFVDTGSAEWLAVAVSNQESIDVLDVSNINAVTNLGQIVTDAPIQALVARDNLIATSDGSIITLIQAASGR